MSLEGFGGQLAPRALGTRQQPQSQMWPGKAGAHALGRGGHLPKGTTSRAEKEVKPARLESRNATPASPEAGIYKAGKNLESLHRVHGVSFKETPARKQILQICRLKATFPAAAAYCTLHSSIGPTRSGYFQTQRSGWQKHWAIFTPRGTQPWITERLYHCRWAQRSRQDPDLHGISPPLRSAASCHGANPKAGRTRARQPRTRCTHSPSRFHNKTSSQDQCQQPIETSTSTHLPG